MRGRAVLAETPWLPFTGRTEGTRAASRAAADRMAPHALTARERVYAAIREAGARGMTDLEIEAATGIKGSTVRPRRIELLTEQPPRIYQDGTKRDGATVWYAR